MTEMNKMEEKMLEQIREIVCEFVDVDPASIRVAGIKE